MKKILLIIICLLTAISSVNAQDKQLSKSEKKSQKVLQKTEREEIEKTLKAYTFCTLEKDLRISKIDRIRKNKEQYLARQTAKNVFDKSIAGGKDENKFFLADNGDLLEGVSRTDSFRIMIDFKTPDYFANVRVDRSIPKDYADDKEILIRWINFVNRERKDSETKFARETYTNNFETYSINRTTIEINEIGATVFFDDKNKIVVTIYFLLQRPNNRKYQNLDEWKSFRDSFLDVYTKCINENLTNLL